MICQAIRQYKRALLEAPLRIRRASHRFLPLFRIAAGQISAEKARNSFSAYPAGQCGASPVCGLVRNDRWGIRRNPLDPSAASRQLPFPVGKQEPLRESGDDTSSGGCAATFPSRGRLCGTPRPAPERRRDGVHFICRGRFFRQPGRATARVAPTNKMDRFIVPLAVHCQTPAIATSSVIRLAGDAGCHLPLQGKAIML